jgi:SAM-dependent methyltransferase
MAVLIKDPAALGRMLRDGCAVCGEREFTHGDVLWQSLIDEWQLGMAEADYINIQQGFRCLTCGSNLRSMVLGYAISAGMGHCGTLQSWVRSPGVQDTAILEINEAGTLTKYLLNLPRHQLVSYPEVDIHSLPFTKDSFDLVIHSDTLEHVPNPTHALAECRRVLRTGGTLVFTTPVIVGRMTRSRNGLPPSFHGAPGETNPGFLVHTEFEADFWTFVVEAGFESLSLILACSRPVSPLQREKDIPLRSRSGLGCHRGYPRVVIVSPAICSNSGWPTK